MLDPAAIADTLRHLAVDAVCKKQNEDGEFDIYHILDDLLIELVKEADKLDGRNTLEHIVGAGNTEPVYELCPCVDFTDEDLHGPQL